MTLRLIAAAGALATIFAVPALADELGIAPSSMDIHSEANASAPRVATIPPGGQFRVMSCGIWCEVEYGDHRGWIAADEVEGTIMESDIEIHRATNRGTVGPN